MKGEGWREEVRRNNRWNEQNRGGHWVESKQLKEGEKKRRDKRDEFENKYLKSEEEYFTQIHV